MPTPSDRTIRNEPDSTTLNILLEVGEKVADLPDIELQNVPPEMAHYLTRENLLTTTVQAVAALRSFDNAARRARVNTTASAA